MDAIPAPSLRDHFSSLSDPRVDRTKRHHLLDLLTIAICNIICGANGWVEIEEFGNAKLPGSKRSSTFPTAFPPTTPLVASLLPLTRTAFKGIDAPIVKTPK